MKLTNRANLPDALVRAVANDPYTGGGDISATTLIGPPQIRVLRQQHEDMLEEDVIERIWSLLGQAVHTILERAGELGLREQRLYMDVLGWSLSGQFDRMVFTPRGTLQDYKVTSAWSALRPKPEWENQLNVLAHLCRANGHDIGQLEIVAIYRDWSKTQAKRSSDYPQNQVGVVRIPLWEPAIAQSYIEQRIRLHQRAASGVPIPCTNEDRWYKGEEWAVMKAGRASALRVLPTEADAKDWAIKNDHCLADGEFRKGITLTFRQGTYTRCEEYCPVRTVCPQWNVSLKQT